MERKEEKETGNENGFPTQNTEANKQDNLQCERSSEPTTGGRYNLHLDSESIEYSEGRINSFENTNQEKDILSSTAYESINRTCTEISPPSQYPLSDLDTEINPDNGQTTVESGLPEKYFLVTAKDDVPNEDCQYYVLLEQDDVLSETDQNLNECFENTQYDQELLLENLSKVSLNRNEESFVNKNFNRSSPISDLSKSANKAPQFYWKVTQQRREPMGSENTENTVYNKAALMVNTSNNFADRTKKNDQDQSGSVVDETVSPATSANVFSDSDTANTDFRLIRPPLVGQSSDICSNNVLSRDTINKQHYSSNSDSTSSSSNTSPLSDDESLHKQTKPIRRDNSTNNSVVAKNQREKLLHNCNKSYNQLQNVHNVSNYIKLNANVVPKNGNSIENEENAPGDYKDNVVTSPAISEPSSLECFQEVTYQKNFSHTNTRDDDKYLPLKNHYFLSSAQSEQLSTINSLEYKNRHQSTDSNDLDSERSGYQSDNRIISPTSISSISSNRKLEWDNGADIGYNAVINAEKNELVNTYRSEPEGIPTFKDNLKTVTTSSQSTFIKDTYKKYFYKRDVKINSDSTKPIPLNSDMLESKKNVSLQSNDEEVCMNHLQKEQISKKRLMSDRLSHSAAIQTDLGDITRDAEVQAQLSARSVGSQSSPDSLSSSSTVKLVNKVGIGDDTDRRSSLSSPLSEPIVPSYSGLMHLDKSLLKSKSDSSTLDISSVTFCLQRSQCSSVDYIENSNHANAKEYENQPVTDILSPEAEYSSTEDSEDLNEQNKSELPQVLLKTNGHFGHELPGSLLLRGIKFSDNREFSPNTNLSKSLSDLCTNTKEMSSSLPMLLPETILPPNITDMSSLRMYLEERYQNKTSKDQISSASRDENILLLDENYEEGDLNGSLVADGPRIRWYPVTGSELPQDIRDAATQTAVSYLTQHATHQTVRNGSIDVGSINYTMLSSELLSKRPITIPSSLNGNFIDSIATNQKQIISNKSQLLNKSDISEKLYLLKNGDVNTEEIHIKNLKHIPTQHYNLSNDALYGKTEYKEASSQYIPDIGKSIIEGRRSNQDTFTQSEDIKSKNKGNTSHSDSEMCENKSIKSSKTYTIPLHLPPLSKANADKIIIPHQAVTVSGNNSSNLKNASDANSILIIGTKLPSATEYQSSVPNSFPKLDKRTHLNHVDSTKIHELNDNIIQKKSIFTKVTPATKSIVMPINTHTNYKKEKSNEDLKENEHMQCKLVKYESYKRAASSTSTKPTRVTSGDTSAQPASSTEYSSYWKVVTENSNSHINELSTPSTSNSEHFGTISALTSEEKSVNNFGLRRTSELLSLDEHQARPKTKSLMVEIKNILSKRNISSNIVQKYAIPNDDMNKTLEVHHHTMPSIHSETTMESTHTGSDDAEPPHFPPHAYGSRLNVEVLSPGIYGSRKYLEKYGKVCISDRTAKHEKPNLLERESVEKVKKDSDVSYRADSNKQPAFNLNHDTSDTSNSSQCVTSVREKQFWRTEDPANILNHENHRIQGVGQETSSSSIQGQTSSTQDQSSSTNVNFSLENSSLSSQKKSNEEISKTESSEINDTNLVTRITSADFGISRLKPSQLAKRELEKLRHLVNKQKRSYIRRLQREVQRLEKFEEVFLSESLKHLSTSSHTSTTNGTSLEKLDKITKRNGINLRNGYSVHDSSYSITTDSVLSSSNNKDLTVPKTKTRKVFTKKLVNTSVNTSQILEQDHQTKQDFSQNFPTPQSSKELLKERMTSIGIQTIDVKPIGKNVVTSGLSDRCFITLDTTANRNRKQDKKSYRYKEKAYVRKRKGSSQTAPKYVQRNIAWFVPLSSAERKKQLLSLGRNFPGVSLQEAFHSNCGHVIRHSQSRLIKIAKLADIRQKQTALNLEKAKLTSELNNHKTEHKLKIEEEKIKPFTHEEMREQTEKVYRKLPEVVEKKEKKKRDQQYKTNRLMAQIYNKKLQEQVLKGKVSWTITQSCLDCNS
ncbi:serine-rich adhesin for platelets-like [Centruroides vittatus]|uniref:serine-rich adhesin for platelets-like n=1 Tax=Centruroides vittatus TaxID=120091 RepID=UPI00350F67BE